MKQRRKTNFFEKIKNLLQFTFEKITYCAKREKKITCREEKSQPPLISNGKYLSSGIFPKLFKSIFLILKCNFKVFVTDSSRGRHAAPDNIYRFRELLTTLRIVGIGPGTEAI